jgi:hypothetical protein
MTEKFYHGTYKSYPMGFELKSQRDGYVQQEEHKDFETLIDRLRPEGRISRFESVFLTADPDLIDCAGGYIDVIYEVTPSSNPQRSDLAWYSDAWYEFETENPDMSKINDLIVKYWSGVPYEKPENSNMEYLVRSAKVARVFELNVDKSELVKVNNIELNISPT